MSGLQIQVTSKSSHSNHFTLRHLTMATTSCCQLAIAIASHLHTLSLYIGLLTCTLLCIRPHVHSCAFIIFIIYLWLYYLHMQHSKMIKPSDIIRLISCDEGIISNITCIFSYMTYRLRRISRLMVSRVYMIISLCQGCS